MRPPAAWPAGLGSRRTPVRPAARNRGSSQAIKLEERRVKALLEQRLVEYAGKPVGVLVRTAEEMAALLAANPFRAEPPNRTVAIFLDEPPPQDALEEVRGRRSERLSLGTREVYVAYGDRMADSKLVIPAAAAGTARNMNTVAKLAAMAGEI